tara:strand:- start:2321 stop:3064 length:744 start_codon:yes stop_codon:yes gene_type:complete
MTDSELTLERLYHPDGHHLGSIVAGLSGSGKTTAIISTLQQAIKSSSFGEHHRFVIIDPKSQPNDYDILAEPHSDIEKAMESIRKERVTLFWPDIEYLEEDVSNIVNYVFALSDTEPKSSFSVIIDEASIMITPTKIPPALKRLSVQGRAKHIKPTFISQRPIINRWTDANLSNMLLFRTLPVDADTLSRRWGIDFEKADENLRQQPYSFLWFNLETGIIKPINPVPLPKVPKKVKRRTWYDLKGLI